MLNCIWDFMELFVNPRVASCKLRVASCKLRVAHCELQMHDIRAVLKTENIFNVKITWSKIAVLYLGMMKG